MKEKATYRLVCDMQGRWAAQQWLCDEWQTVNLFTERNEKGYNEARQWMEENL